MWALTKRAIRNAEVLQLLSEWKTRGDLDSDCWVLPQNLSFFGTRARPSAHPPLTLPFSLLRDDIPQLRAVPFGAIPYEVRRSVLRAAPPPAVTDTVPHIVEHSPGRSGRDEQQRTFAPGNLRWRACSLEELFDAAVSVNDAGGPYSRLLCSTSLVPDAIPHVDSVTLLNAQDTVNPFAVDPSLVHWDALTGSPLPHVLSSGLTTVACQFRYRCLRWVEVLHGDARAPVVEAALSAHARPHLVAAPEPILLAHLSQLPLTEQTALVAAVPRHVLFKAASTPFVLRAGRWVPGFRLDLERRLSHREIPPPASVQADVQPLLWVALEESDLPGVAGQPLRLTRFPQRTFLNLEQLPLPSPGNAA